MIKRTRWQKRKMAPEPPFPVPPIEALLALLGTGNLPGREEEADWEEETA